MKMSFPRAKRLWNYIAVDAETNTAIKVAIGSEYLYLEGVFGPEPYEIGRAKLIAKFLRAWADAIETQKSDPLFISIGKPCTKHTMCGGGGAFCDGELPSQGDW